MSCRESNCCDPDPFQHRADAGPAESEPCDPPGTSPCSDPAYAAANPEECLLAPRLLLKPSSATVQVLQDVRYRAYLWINGVEEELTEGVIYSVDDTTIVLIGAASGNATGVSAGVTTVNAAWGTLTATAQIEVIADCGTRVNHFLFLHDVSYSMTGEFGGDYDTLLDFAKAMALDFVGRTNWAKDEAAALEFDTAVRENAGFTQDRAVIEAAIYGLAAGEEVTDLAAAMTGAGEYFDNNAVEADGRVVLLFSDGVNKTGADAIAAADAMRASGVILIVVGLRASGDGFRRLQRMASGGFFINAKPDNYASVADWLNGMRSYLCSGNCEPCGGETLGVGQLNFNSFINWDVLYGVVDLIGKNPGGTPLYDFLPGNGLYVDGCGSGGGVPNNLGVIRTKNPIAVTAGNQLQFTLQVAGNQREDRTPDVTQISIYDQADNLVASKTITVTDYVQDFTDYTLNYTVGVGVTGVKLVIRQYSIPGGATDVFGSLWDNVVLTDQTAAAVLFEDDFDGDNPTYIDPGCCYGYGDDYCAYGNEYCCYGTGCLEGPVPQQSGDEDPLPDIETDVITPPPPPPPPPSSNICNLDFRQTGPTAKSGAAAAGLAGDFWNTINFTPGGAAHGAGDDILRWADGTVSTVTYSESLELSANSIFAAGENTAHGDPMMRKAGVTINDGRFKFIQFDEVPRGVYDVYIYGHGNADARTLEVELATPLTSHGTKTTENSAAWLGGWVDGKNYVKFSDVTWAALEETDIRLNFPINQAVYINGIQLVKKS